MADMLLMMKDTAVMRVNFDEGIYDVLCQELIPFELKGKLRRIPDYSEIKSKYDDVQRTVAMNKCRDAIISFLAHRTLPITRYHAKKIYDLFGFSQLQDDISKTKIALVCRAVSLQDNYWVKLEGDKISWDNVNLRTNHLNEVVTQVALHGTSLSLTGVPDVVTPELTCLGAYAKAWIREDDGLYLHKLGSPFSENPNEQPVLGSWESKIEVMVSNILDACNVDHLKYEQSSSINPRTQESMYTCRCKCMTTEDISMLSGGDFTSWCNVNGMDPFSKALEIDAKSIYKMWIVDYLISNRDRHGLNWGFFYNCNTMEILGCHPLYDHNNAFDVDTMQDKDREYLYDNRMTMRQAAKKAMENVDFHFTRELTRADFLTDRQYQSFKDRADELGIPVVSGLPQDAYRQQALQLFIDTGRPDLLEDFLTTLPSVDCDLMAAFTAYCTIKNIQ